MVDEVECISSLIEETETYLDELRTHCVESMFCREYSCKAKHPFKVMFFVNSMTWRMYDMAYGCIALMKQNLVVPSLCLIRACWENMVTIYELKELISDCCERHKLPSTFDSTLMRTLFSNRFEKDNVYIGEEHFEQFKEYKATNILTLLNNFMKEFPKAKDVYSVICEFVHPNGDGDSGSYSYVDEASHTVQFGPQFNQDSWLYDASIAT